MRFEEAYEGWQKAQLRQGKKRPGYWGVCERTFRRYIDRFEEAGLEGLADRRLEQVSARCFPSMRRCGAHRPLPPPTP